MSFLGWVEEKLHAPQDPEAEALAQARRKALHALTMGSAGALVALATAGRAADKPPEPPPAPAHGAAPGKKHNWGMAIDLDKCTGCGGCVVACQTENNLPQLSQEQMEQSRGIFWMDLLGSTEGAYPNLTSGMLPVPCMQCDDAPCVKVCPVGATYMGEDGIVEQIYDRCIGCRYCMVACPYSRRYFNWTAPEWSPSEQQALNPNVSARPGGVVEKCTFCSQRIRAAKEQARADEEPLTDAKLRHLPACAQTCPAQAITFGDLNDSQSSVSLLHGSPRAVRLLEELGTKPKVVYLRETKWRD